MLQIKLRMVRSRNIPRREFVPARWPPASASGSPRRRWPQRCRQGGCLDQPLENGTAALIEAESGHQRSRALDVLPRHIMARQRATFQG